MKGLLDIKLSMHTRFCFNVIAHAAWYCGIGWYSWRSCYV